jgi:uncharacterized membrane protein YbhN (UPF0104 family)
MSPFSIASALVSRRHLVLGAEMLPVTGRKVPSRSQSLFVLKSAVSVLLLGGVLVAVAYRYGVSDILAYLHQLSPMIVGLIAFGLLANATLAVLRFQVLASDAGHPIKWRRAMAAVGAGSLAGALFFQIAGQLMARGVVMRRGGVPFGAVVVVTLYERIVAAAVSGLIAIFGAVHIFGRVYLDQSTGGGQFVKLVCGIAAAVGVAGLLGFGKLAEERVWPLLTRQFVLRLLRIAGLTILVQLPMMGVYVALAHQFSPQTSIPDLVAASAVVMFAASVPISLAGWGVRELSAVMALGAIGMPASGALTTAIIIGAGSLLAMGAIFVLSMHDKGEEVLAAESESVAAIDYSQALGWILPLMAAVFVLFQIYLPIGSGLLNVNLADPVVILGGSLFVLRAVGRKQFPSWRIQYVNQFAFLATLALGLSLLIGASRFGWTNWALINRFLGWFILLAYAMTGALITSTGGMRALRVLAMTYVGAAAGVVLIELAMLLLGAVGFNVRDFVALDGIEGFAQNHNFLAFQLLMAASAALVLFSGTKKQVIFGLLLVGLWFAGSRSGWISACCILVAALHLRQLNLREVLGSFGFAIAVVAIVALIPIASDHLASPASIHGQVAGSALPAILPTEASSTERLVTLSGGWKMFLEHPIFGAGLGAFRNLNILATSGIPLVIHSTALWLLAELGLLGFLVFAIPGFYIWASEWRLAARDPTAAIITLCFVGFAVMSGPADMVYQRTFWLLIGAALAVPRLLREAVASPSQS